MKIAIVEDSPHLAYQLKTILSENHYIVRDFRDGRSAIASIPVDEFDICIIDVNLPDMDGYEVCQKIRASHPDVLVLFLTVRDNIEDKIKGFNAGGDDYLTKPFEIPELLARIKALSKRKGLREPDLVEIGNLTVNYDNQTIIFDSKEIDFSPKEFHILEYLIRNRGLIVSKDKIGDLIWDNPYEMSENIVAVYIGKIRKKLQDFTGEPFIKTVKNKGYLIDAK